MSTKQARGTKRTCQSSACGSRFYDLNRSPIECPLCGSKYVIASAPLMADAVHVPAPAPSKEFADADALAPGDAPEAESAELADVEGSEEPVAAAEDETFLEEEEDAGDVSAMVDVGGEDEEEA